MKVLIDTEYRYDPQATGIKIAPPTKYFAGFFRRSTQDILLGEGKRPIDAIDKDDELSASKLVNEDTFLKNLAHGHPDAVRFLGAPDSVIRHLGALGSRIRGWAPRLITASTVYAFARAGQAESRFHGYTQQITIQHLEMALLYFRQALDMAKGQGLVWARADIQEIEMLAQGAVIKNTGGSWMRSQTWDSIEKTEMENIEKELEKGYIPKRMKQGELKKMRLELIKTAISLNGDNI